MIQHRLPNSDGDSPEGVRYAGYGPGVLFLILITCVTCGAAW